MKHRLITGLRGVLSEIPAIAALSIIAIIVLACLLFENNEISALTGR